MIISIFSSFGKGYHIKVIDLQSSYKEQYFLQIDHIFTQQLNQAIIVWKAICVKKPYLDTPVPLRTVKFELDYMWQERHADL